jgi:hypothetical protein
MIATTFEQLYLEIDLRCEYLEKDIVRKIREIGKTEEEIINGRFSVMNEFAKIASHDLNKLGEAFKAFGNTMQGVKLK